MLNIPAHFFNMLMIAILIDNEDVLCILLLTLQTHRLCGDTLSLLSNKGITNIKSKISPLEACDSVMQFFI